MRREINQTRLDAEPKELGHEVEGKILDFMSGSFDCIQRVEKTRQYGLNDKKGIDAVLVFEDGSRIAVDITTDVGLRVDEKIKSMQRSKLARIEEEFDDNGQVSVSLSDDLVPRVLIRKEINKWAEYNIENIDGEIIVYMSDKTRIDEEKDILDQLIRQIDFMSKGNDDLSIKYKKATTKLRGIIAEELEELKRLETELG